MDDCELMPIISRISPFILHDDHYEVRTQCDGKHSLVHLSASDRDGVEMRVKPLSGVQTYVTSTKLLCFSNVQLMPPNFCSLMSASLGYLVRTLPSNVVYEGTILRISPVEPFRAPAANCIPNPNPRGVAKADI